MIIHLSRLVLFAAGALGGFLVSGLVDWAEATNFPHYLVIIMLVVLGAAIGYLVGGILGRELARGYDYVEERVTSLSTSEVILGIVGLILGLVVALLASYPLRLLEPRWIGFLGSAVMSLLLGYGGFRIVLTKRGEFARSFGRISGDPPSLTEAPPLLKHLDTSAVIDGRFAEIRRHLFLEGRVVTPRFVLAELHTLADSADDQKRSRGRRGLDLLETLQQDPYRVEVFEADFPEIPDVDSKLVRLAKETGGAIVTVDHNLAKFARVQGVRVLDVNELAMALKPGLLSGDEMELSIVREGKEPGQGVGYLEDGTMVVVEEADGDVGGSIEIVVTSVFQSSAGRMIFAKKKAR